MPDEKLIPLPYQEADIRQLVQAGGSGLVVSGVGGRKTLVAVETGLRLGSSSVLVIAPKGTHTRTWRRTILRQDPTAIVRDLGGDEAGLAAFEDLKWGEPGWYLTSPQWFARQDWNSIIPDLAIFDEVHTAGAYHNTTRLKLHQLKAIQRMAMSGTPLRNKFENAWAIVKWLWPELMPMDFWSWRRVNCAGVWDRFAPQKFRVTGERNPGELVNSLPVYIQHLAREKCCEFHPKGFLADLEAPVEITRTVEMTTKQTKFYNQMAKDYVAWLTTPDESGKLPVVAELPAVAHNWLRFCALGMPSYDMETEKLYFADDCESPKLDDLHEVMEELEYPQMIVYTHSQRFAAVAAKRIQSWGVTAFEWSGAVSQKKRDKALEAFIAGEVQVVVAVISAVGTGTDGIQEACNVEYWLSLDADAVNNEQARGRADRPGQTRQVLRIQCNSEGTDDEGILPRQIERALVLNRSLRRDPSKAKSSVQQRIFSLNGVA